MKRSSAVHLVLLTAAVVTLEGCGSNSCVDQHYNTVDDKNCRTGSSGYHYVGSGVNGTASAGSSVEAQGTTRGVFGGAGESASHGGEGGGGHGAGGGE